MLYQALQSPRFLLMAQLSSCGRLDDTGFLSCEGKRILR